MAIQISDYQVWTGLVTKGGGMLFVVGMETLSGHIIRLDALKSGDASAFWACGATPGFRLGLGLGGSVGVSLIIVLNTQFYVDLHGLDIGGPGLNIAFEDRFGKVPLSANEYRALEAMAKGVMNMKNSNLLTNVTNTLINNLNYGGSGPVAFMFDLPGVGYGLELSAVYTLEYKLQLNALMT